MASATKLSEELQQAIKDSTVLSGNIEAKSEFVADLDQARSAVQKQLDLTRSLEEGLERQLQAASVELEAAQNKDEATKRKLCRIETAVVATSDLANKLLEEMRTHASGLAECLAVSGELSPAPAIRSAAEACDSPGILTAAPRGSTCAGLSATQEMKSAAAAAASTSRAPLIEITEKENVPYCSPPALEQGASSSREARTKAIATEGPSVFDLDAASLDREAWPKRRRAGGIGAGGYVSLATAWQSKGCRGGVEAIVEDLCSPEC